MLGEVGFGAGEGGEEWVDGFFVGFLGAKGAGEVFSWGRD